MRLLLEGPAIEPLLERVRTEHGEDARIVHAERVRTGGVGGFFSREHFEVTVEVDPVAVPVPAPVPAPAPAVVTSGLSGLDALIAAAEAEELGDQPISQPISQPAHHPAHQPAARTVPETPAMTTPAASPPEPLAAAPAAPAPAAWVFPQVSAARTATLDAFAPAAAAPDLRPDPEPVPGPHRPVSTESSAFADLMQRLVLENAHPVPLPAAHEPGTDLVLESFVPHPRLPERAADTGPGVEEPAAVEPAVAGRRGRRVRQEGQDLVARLLALGVPAHLLTGPDPATDLGVVAARLQGALSAALAPVPDLARPGHVVLVVGEQARAGAAAAALAARYRLSADAVVDLGAAGAAPTADQVRRELARLRGGDTGAVVVLGADPVADPGADPWLSAIARSLGADHVLACVDATRKVADVAAWLAGLERLGLTVDALDVHHVRSTSDPAAVLGLGVPVVALDGGAADGAAWTALLLERLLREDGAR